MMERTMMATRSLISAVDLMVPTYEKGYRELLQSLAVEVQ